MSRVEELRAAALAAVPGYIELVERAAMLERRAAEVPPHVKPRFADRAAASTVVAALVAGEDVADPEAAVLAAVAESEALELRKNLLKNAAHIAVSQANTSLLERHQDDAFAVLDEAMRAVQHRIRQGPWPRSAEEAVRNGNVNRWREVIAIADEFKAIAAAAAGIRDLLEPDLYVEQQNTRWAVRWLSPQTLPMLPQELLNDRRKRDWLEKWPGRGVSWPGFDDSLVGGDLPVPEDALTMWLIGVCRRSTLWCPSPRQEIDALEQAKAKASGVVRSTAQTMDPRPHEALRVEMMASRRR